MWRSTIHLVPFTVHQKINTKNHIIMKKYTIYFAIALIFGVAITSCKKKDKTVRVDAITLSQPAATMFVGDTLTLTPIVIPEKATNKRITWASTTPAVASVVDGRVIALTVGTTTIIATTQDGGKTATCNITVNPADPGAIRVESVSLNRTSDTLNIGDSVTLTASVLPTNADNKKVLWTSSNAAVASVTEGKVKGVSTGSATITVATEDGGKTATYAVLVVAKNVSLGTQQGTLTSGTAGTATYAVTTQNIANGKTGTITWYSDPEGTTVMNQPIGITATVSAVANNAATVTINTTDAVPVGTYRFRAVIDGVQSGVATLVIGAGGTTKTVSVSAQTSELAATVFGFATYTITTANIADGTYTVGVTNRPIGVEVFALGNNVTISGNTGTLILSGNGVAAGTYDNLTLMLDGVTSAPFTLTVSATATKKITTGTQIGTLTEFMEGTATFAVTTENIPDGTTGSVVWFDNASGLNASAVANITATVSNVSGNTATVTVNTTNAVWPGMRYFRVNFGGTLSNVAVLAIVAPPSRTITNVTQVGTLTAGVVGVASFTFTSTDFADGDYAATIGNRPAGLSSAAVAKITGNNGTFSLTGNASTIAGLYSDVTITASGATSDPFTITISPQKSVTVGTQTSTPIAGVNSNVTFPVTTIGIANGTYELTANNLPAGVAYQMGATITITNNVGVLQLTCRGSNTVAGTYTNLTLTIDGTTSPAFTLIIAAP
jgi:hypothetical protein